MKTLCRMEVLGNLDRTGKAVQQDIARIQDKCYRLQPGGDGEGERSEPVLVSDPPLRAVLFEQLPNTLADAPDALEALSSGGPNNCPIRYASLGKDYNKS